MTQDELKNYPCKYVYEKNGYRVSWGHIWIYEGKPGTEMPNWWPCQCGELRHDGTAIAEGLKNQVI